MGENQTSRQRALILALCTHAIWGSMPLYLLLVNDVPPLEYVAWRTLFTLPVCLFFVVRVRHAAPVAADVLRARAPC